ncbi:IS3 family transposase [Corynebacterium pseudodiphtheriticum]|uniref:IS3 family transposase n=1 Tax=Corynebacterium pseudodiphtheriticum TaxID=37637 RepID=UPI003AF2AF2C
MEHVRSVHANNHRVYGVRKMCHTLQREGIDIGREQTARLIHLAEHGITASTRTVGDSYDNTLASARQPKLNQSFGRAARFKKR